MAQHPHLIIPTNVDPIRFTSPSSGPRDRLGLPERRRGEHAQELLAKIEEIAPQAETRAEEQHNYGIDAGTGIISPSQANRTSTSNWKALTLQRTGSNSVT